MWGKIEKIKQNNTESTEGERKEVVQNEKSASVEQLVNLAEARTKERQINIEKTLKNRNENGSVRLDELEISKEEADNIIVRSQRGVEAVRENLGEKIKNANNEDLNKVFAEEREEAEKIKTDEESVKREIKEKIIEERIHESIRENKKEIILILSGAEQGLKKDLPEILNESDLKRAVEIRELVRSVNFIQMIVDNLPLKSVGFNGIDKLRDYDKKIGQFKKLVENIKSKNSIEDIKQLMVSAESELKQITE